MIAMDDFTQIEKEKAKKWGLVDKIE